MDALLPISTFLERSGRFMQCAKHGCEHVGLRAGRHVLQQVDDGRPTVVRCRRLGHLQQPQLIRWHSCSNLSPWSELTLSSISSSHRLTS